LRVPEEVDFTKEHLVEKIAQCPDIDCSIISLTVKEFRRHIRICTQMCLIELLLGSKAKVSQFVDSFFDDDIVRFDIAMYDIIFCDECECC
jgi:hypothetical protein